MENVPSINYYNRGAGGQRAIAGVNRIEKLFNFFLGSLLLLLLDPNYYRLIWNLPVMGYIKNIFLDVVKKIQIYIFFVTK